MHQVSFLKTLALMDPVNNFFESLIDDITFYLENIAPWAAGLVLLGVAILLLIGFFVVLKKFIKAFIVLGVLGGAVYIIYTKTDILNDILKVIL
ncbi:MAG: hypothetical protein K9L64_02230 [Candidatus Izimaplasma sp.]|nr:hypothetical protein [Candidatus Izimaplasma bacterium]